MIWGVGVFFLYMYVFFSSYFFKVTMSVVVHFNNPLFTAHQMRNAEEGRAYLNGTVHFYDVAFRVPLQMLHLHVVYMYALSVYSVHISHGSVCHIHMGKMQIPLENKM